MDPDACYEKFLEHLKAGDVNLAEQAADALYHWFRKGGAVPGKLKRCKMSTAVLAEKFFATSLVLLWAEADLSDGD